jgi:hypothetical protein
MTSAFHLRRAVAGEQGKLPRGRAVFAALFPVLAVLVLLAGTRPVSAQVASSGDAGGFTLSAGATASGYEVQYGEQKLLGVAAIVDVDTRRRIGLEAEARWLLFHQTNDLHVTTWEAGPRYHFTHGKFQFYGKGLIGVGQFNFPYNYAKGTYLLIAPGGGVDYRWSRKVTFRLADVEYQYWPQFTYGAMTSVGVSVGVRYNIF